MEVVSSAAPSDRRPDGQSCFAPMTPMEYDIQLQVAELVFRSLLEGKRPQVCHPTDIDTWHEQTFGKDWVEKNKAQRQEVEQRTEETGEFTPMWMEASAHMSDIAWEVFEGGSRGERLRRRRDVDRTEVLEQFRELLPKVQMSYFARNGAGDQLVGLRACIAVLRIFLLDHEVLSLCARCLTEIISDCAYNRDGLAFLSLPMPPAERHRDDAEHGWAFLRAALEAFMVQAGAAPYGGSAHDVACMDTDGFVAVDSAMQQHKEVAAELAKLLLVAAGGVSPGPLTRQLVLLRRGAPADEASMCQERVELVDMIGAARKKAIDLAAEAGSPPEFAKLAELLSSQW